MNRKEKAQADFAATVDVQSYRAKPRYRGRLLFWLRQVVFDLGPGVVLYLAFGLFRWWRPDYATQNGEQNAERVIAAQENIGLSWEGELQSFALEREWIIIASNWFYILGFVPFMIVAAAIAMWKRPVVFERWRQVFAVTLALTALTQIMFPLTPPRLLEGAEEMVDTLAVYGPNYYGDGDSSAVGLFNVHGAMPSMHAGWPALVGAALWVALSRPWWLIPVVALHLILMSWSVVVTGNHFILDIVAGLGIVGVSMIVVAFIGVRRRNAANLKRSPPVPIGAQGTAPPSQHPRTRTTITSADG